MKSNRSVLVYGAGAVGSLFGWRLAHHGYGNVSVVCRSNYERVRQLGFTFQTRAWGDGLMQPLEVYRAGRIARSPRKKPFDMIVYATKITKREDYSAAIQDLSPFIGPNTTLVSTQNGMDVELPLQQAYPQNTILSAVCNVGCTQMQPGLIVQTAQIKPHTFHIGIHSSGQSVRNAQMVRDSLASVDPAFKTIGSVVHERWRKLVFNCAFNSTCALTGLNTHTLLEQPGATELVLQLAGEAYQVALAQGIDLGEDLPLKVVDMAQQSPAITPSALQDATAGKTMELEPIFGYLTKQARQLGVQTPHLRVMYEMLENMNEKLSDGHPPRSASPPILLDQVTNVNSVLRASL